MISRHHLELGGGEHTPAWCLSLWTGWNSWLLGIDWQRHPHEWQATLHLGPIALSIERNR